VSNSATNLYSEPVGLPDPFAESNRLSNIVTRSREICGLPPFDLPEPINYGRPTGVSDDLVVMYQKHQGVQRVLASDNQGVLLADSQREGMEQR